jgi:hypothetical protein
MVVMCTKLLFLLSSEALHSSVEIHSFSYLCGKTPSLCLLFLSHLNIKALRGLESEDFGHLDHSGHSLNALIKVHGVLRRTVRRLIQVSYRLKVMTKGVR